MNMKNIPRIDKINDAKSHIVKFSFRISKVNRMAQMVLDPDLAATAASGKINENALKINRYRIRVPQTGRWTYVKTQLEAME